MKRRVSSQPFGSKGNPILPAIKVVGSLEMPFFLAANYAAVGFDFSSSLSTKKAEAGFQIEVFP
jgi:hypothetical protein